MNNSYIAKLRMNHFSQETAVHLASVFSIAYFLYTCFPEVQDALMLFFVLISVAATLELSGGYLFKFHSARYIREVVSAKDVDAIPHHTMIKAKRQAYRLPLAASMSIFFRWFVVSNVTSALPFVIVEKAPLITYLYISAFFFFAGLSTMPYVYLSTEAVVSDFLRLRKISEIDLNKENMWKFTLTPKIISLILTVLIPPLAFLLLAIAMCQTFDISLDSVKLGFFIVILQALFFSLMTGVLFARSIKHSVDDVVHVLKEISQREGDLTRVIKSASNDEIGDLAYWFNKFSRNMREIITSIIENAGSLDKSSNELSQFSRHLSGSANEMSMQSNMVAASAEEMSANIQSVASSMGEAAENVNIVAASTEEMTVSINEIAENSEKARSVAGNAVSYAKNASLKVDQLEEAARDISKITEVISEISEQTNLLSLNATIEAARAGDAGKSFAVVASEIKELAGQTAEATKEIRSRIEGIQNSTGSTIAEIKKISEIIHDVNEIVDSIASAVEEQAVTTKEISGNIAQASAGNQDVSRKVDESSKVSAGIAEEISSVYKSANKISTDSSKLNQSAVELSEMAQLLKNLVNRFKI